MSQTCGEYNASLTAPAAPPLSPGGDPGEVENDAGWAAVGVVLCELAVFMIALGSDVQRYALTVIEPERRCFGRFSLQNTLWLVGLLTYFGGNGVFVAALGLAPASLCAALMATVVVANALISRVLLKEQLERCDYHGGALIMLGIAVTAAFAPYTSIEYTAGAVGSLIVHPAGLTYLLTLVCFFFCIMFLVLRDEKREREHAHKLECELRVSSAQSRAAAALELSSSAGSAGPGAGGAAGGGAGGGAGGAAGGAAGDASPGRGAGGGAELVAERNSRLHALMPFCYPVLIGTLETLVQMCMKVAGRAHAAPPSPSPRRAACAPPSPSHSSLTHPLAHSLSLPLTRSLAHPLTSRSLPRSPSHVPPSPCPSLCGAGRLVDALPDALPAVRVAG